MFGYTALEEGLLHGNRELIGFFAAAIGEGRLSHAYILEGPEGSGKHTLARAVAASLSRSEQDGRKILEGLCPDVMVYGLEHGARSIGIETVRAVREAAYISPVELDFKFFVIEDAHRMTVQAQNGLLKLLEEPPRGVYFMLLCENTVNLLATIRSRAPVVRMERFEEERLAELLCGEKKPAEVRRNSPEVFAAAVKNADGSYGRALAALSSRSKKGTGGEEAVRQILSFLARRQRAELLLYAHSLPSKREELYDLAAQFRTALRDLTAAKFCTACPMLFYPDRSSAALDAEGFTVRNLLVWEEATSALLDRLDANVNLSAASLGWLETMSGR